ncbi:MAG TPA: hypothetical protein VIH76_07750 [Candidatus Acidoferrales bacterium]
MPRYLSQHTLACHTRQGAEELTARLNAATKVKARRVLLAMHDGKFARRIRCHEPRRIGKVARRGEVQFDWVLRIDYEASGGGLSPV